MGYKQKSPIIVAEGGTGVQSNTAYAVLCGGTTSTGAIQSIASVGTSGQYLVSNGASALPTFQTFSVATGALVLLHTASCASVNNVVFNNTYITATYGMYMVAFNAVDNSQGMDLFLSTDNGSTYITSGYNGGTNYAAYNSTSFTNTNSTVKMPIYPSGGSNSMTGTLYIAKLAASAIPTFVGTFFCDTSNVIAGGVYPSSSTVNAIKFSSASGSNWSTGTISLYGLTQ